MNEKIKVLHVTTSYPKNDSDVCGIFIKRLIDSLIKKGIDCQVLTSCTSSPKDFCDKAVITFRYAPWKLQCLTHSPGGILSCLRKKPAVSFLLPSFVINMFVKLLLAARRTHIIHAHWTLSGAIACLTKHIHHKKVVTTIRGSDFNESNKLPLHTLMKISLDKSDKIICVSQALKENIQRQYPEYASKIVYIPNGVGEEFLNAKLKKEKPLTLTFTTVCSLVPNKRVDVILKAFSYLRELPVILNIVGDGDLRPNLIKLSQELKIEDRVNFLGQIPPSQIPMILANSEGFILASEKEGRSNALLEAMACGNVIFASNIPANRELISHAENGFLFEVGDALKLSELIREFYHKFETKKEVGTKARETILKLNLNWDRCAEEHKRLYLELLNA